MHCPRQKPQSGHRPEAREAAVCEAPAGKPVGSTAGHVRSGSGGDRGGRQWLRKDMWGALGMPLFCRIMAFGLAKDMAAL